MLEDLGTSVVAASTSTESGTVEMLAGDPVAAERDLRRDFEALAEMGEKYLLSTIAAVLAQALYAQGRYADAAEAARVAEELSAEDDIAVQALWRSVRAKVLARGGGLDEARVLAREAVELMRPTDALASQADALVDLAEVLELAGEDDEARVALEEAVALLARKGNVVSAERARALLVGRAAEPTQATA
jgi:tetratricopeptide (TPR) repeat protein